MDSGDLSETRASCPALGWEAPENTRSRFPPRPPGQEA